MTSNVAPSSGRNAGIDLLRGVSILLVVMNHIGLRIPLHRTALGELLPAWLLKALIYNGLSAVYVFFVVSGFLIARNALARWGSLGAVHLRDFYVRRFARIVPLLTLLIAVLAVLHAVGAHDYVIHRPGQSLIGAVASAFGLYLNVYEAHTGYLPGNWDVLWSLSIEEVFYLAFPLLCLLLRRRRAMVPLLVLLAVSLPYTRGLAEGNEIWMEKAYLPGMSAIACGVLGALLAARWQPSLTVARTMIASGALVLTGLLLRGDLLWPYLGHGVMLLLVLSTAVLVLGLHARAAASPAPRPLPGFGWLRVCGRLSYEIYLTHMFVVYAAVDLYRATGKPLATGFLWYPPILLLTAALGAVVARWVSQPCERALRARWLQRRGVVSGKRVEA
ncbi:acyltransferase family protein [Oleiagrimonas soli]|uniref:Acyltransferase n=1 Tax=Oleiagrimonas soli TaxID=1543381 RepID=A0A099CZ56_9GAMM|nr:acyltransferase [Oleiagrimonas soli]KGI79273.1 acyltransferase [Oleiagrimonas soli]MBB6184832.1 peptidoglycan/LPS O-acetylase OafA/YrhL [Oleiagrimonas soli]